MTSLPAVWKVRATLAAVLLPPLLPVVSLTTLTRWIDRRRTPGRADPRADDALLSAWVDRLLARLPGPWKRTCLSRAVVLYYLLRRAGNPAELWIGVRRGADCALAAHAWLVRQGRPVLEDGADRLDSYRVLTAFP